MTPQIAMLVLLLLAALVGSARLAQRISERTYRVSVILAAIIIEALWFGLVLLVLEQGGFW